MVTGYLCFAVAYLSAVMYRLQDCNSLWCNEVDHNQALPPEQPKDEQDHNQALPPEQPKDEQDSRAGIGALWWHSSWILVLMAGICVWLASRCSSKHEATKKQDVAWARSKEAATDMAEELAKAKAEQEARLKEAIELQLYRDVISLERQVDELRLKTNVLEKHAGRSKRSSLAADEEHRHARNTDDINSRVIAVEQDVTVVKSRIISLESEVDGSDGVSLSDITPEQSGSLQERVKDMQWTVQELDGQVQKLEGVITEDGALLLEIQKTLEKWHAKKSDAINPEEAKLCKQATQHLASSKRKEACEMLGRCNNEQGPLLSIDSLRAKSVHSLENVVKKDTEIEVKEAACIALKLLAAHRRPSTTAKVLEQATQNGSHRLQMAAGSASDQIKEAMHTEVLKTKKARSQETTEHIAAEEEEEAELSSNLGSLQAPQPAG